MLEFKLKPFVVKNKKPSVEIIEKDAEGVIVEDSSTGELQVNIRDKYYTIHPDCYDTTKKRSIYKKDNSGRWYEYDRPYFDDRVKNDNYFPFKPKMAVKGNIIMKDNILYFKIKVSWIKNNINSYEEAMKDIDE